MLWKMVFGKRAFHFTFGNSWASFLGFFYIFVVSFLFNSKSFSLFSREREYLGVVGVCFGCFLGAFLLLDPV